MLRGRAKTQNVTLKSTMINIIDRWLLKPYTFLSYVECQQLIMKKTILWIFCICASLLTPCVFADVYKCSGDGGTPTFVDGKTKANYQNCQLMMRDNGSKVPYNKQATATATPSDFPKVNKQTQSQRDEKRKEILLSELRAEQSALETIKTQPTSSEINLHQQNIQLLKKEINALK